MMAYYHFKVKYQDGVDEGYVLAQGTIHGVMRILMYIYGVDMELVELTEVTKDEYQAKQHEKYETPNTKHMQDIPGPLHGWRVRDN
jgi:hypothetical protein